MNDRTDKNALLTVVPERKKRFKDKLKGNG